MSTNVVLEVDRADCGRTRLVETSLEPLTDDQVRLRIRGISAFAMGFGAAVVWPHSRAAGIGLAASSA
ncbi:MAG: hypothetical protein ACXWB2_13125, partial [Acidimicrobiales bacterium]